MSEHLPEGFAIRTMTRADVDLAVAWARREGWNPGANDAECFYAVDPNGFFIGELNGEPVATISAVAYDDAFGFAGFYIVAPEHRDAGLGMAMFRHAVDYLGNRNIGGDGVLEMVPKYETAGFKQAYRNARYEGVGRDDAVPDTVPLADVPFDAVEAYDRAHFPAPRTAFLRAWLSQPNAAGCALRDGARLRGYGVMRACAEGYKIAPLFADGPDEADALFRALSAQAAGAPIYLDIPEPNEGARALVARYGMSEVFATARLYTKEAPDLPLDEIYGVTSFELG